MSSSLEIRVLGDLQVLRDGETIELPPSKKARALLAYLAVVERPQRRERLCEMFWDVPDDPRGALRWSLSRIRGILNDGSGDLFAADRNAVAVNPDAVNTDLARVRRLLTGGIDGLDDGALREIADRFRGFFLEDLSLPRCPDFEAWRVSHVNELELLRLDVLRRLVDTLQGEPELALPYAHQLHRLLPDEPGLPKLVSSLADAAKRQSAGRVSSMPARLPQPTAEKSLTPPEPTAQPQADVRFCTTRDGVSVAYALTGSGPAIVRAAHWMSHIAYDVESPVWRHWIRDLSAETTLLRYDERGNGLSQWDVDDIGFEAMVADLESIIDAAGLQRVVLLGVSQSCAISVAYAVRHPERVHGLILYGGYVRGWRARGNPSEIALREAMGTLMREGWGQDDPMFRQLFTSLFIPGASREQMDWFNDLQRRTVTPDNAFRLAESFSHIDVTDLLPQVSVPTLVIHARGDRVSPIESGKQFAAAIRGARFVELDSSNHILLEGEPAFDIFIREVRRFVADVTAPRSARVDTSNTKRPVSVLVADIVSPLHAFEMFDPEIAAAELDPIVRIVRDLIQAHGGLLVDSREGMVTAAFGATRAFEQHTVSACRAARAIRDAVANAAGGSMKIRIGIDAGEAVVQNAEARDGRANVAGPVVKGAMRLANALKRDTIALSVRARESAGGFVTAVRMTRADCPGVARDETVFELLAENKALSRWYLRAQQGLTPLIGREGEIEKLALAWHGAREGIGAAIGIVGNPGVGKSRLAHEFVGSESLKGYTLVEAGAEEVDGSSSHSLVKRILLSFFGLEEGEDDHAVMRTVRRRFAALGLGANHLTPVLYTLDQPVQDPEWQSAQGADRARRVREAVATLVCRAAEAKPLVILVEDLHWADAESCKVLGKLVQAVTGRRILLLLTYRPGFQPPWDGVGDVSAIRLSPLPEEESRAFVDALLGDDPSLADIHALICERADGVPLFIEEIVGSLVQSKRLAGRPGTMRLLRPTGHLDIPASVHSVIAARIDKLDPPDRALLQIAAVIGAVAPAPLLQMLSGLGPQFAPSAARLTAAELLYETSSGAEAEFAFKHALIHDATYASLTTDRRRSLHADTLAALERGQAARQADQVERLAHHAVRAEDWVKATRYLMAAADRAIERSAYPAAGEFLEQAIGALQRLPATPDNLTLGVDIRTRMRIAYMVTGDFEKAIARLTEAQDLARRTDDPIRLAYALLHTSYVYSTFGRVDQSLAVAEEARAIGALLGDERQIAEADLAAAQAHMIRGDAGPSLRLLLPHATDFMTRWADDRMGFLVTRSVWYLGSLASTRALLGEDAEADIAETLRLAEASQRPIDRYAAAYFESLIRILTGPDADYLAHLRRLATESLDRAPFPFHAWLTATLGHAELRAGRTAEAVATLEEAFDAAEQSNMPHFMTYASALAAVAHARRGDPGSRDDLVDALRNARVSADRWVEIEVLLALAAIDEEERPHWLEEASTVAAAANYGSLSNLVAEAIDSLETPARLRVMGSN